MLTRRLADLSGPFFDPHKPFRNWSSFPFSQIDLPQPPYVDEAQLRAGLGRAKLQLHALHAQGYTGIVLDNLAHLTAFDGPGEAVYAPDSPARLRALAYRAAFGELFDMAAALSMEVYVTSDMQWSTPELRRAAGPMRADNPRLAALNRRAVAELFAAMPQVRGLVVRVGEAGGAHNEGDSYAGHMIYTTPAQLRGLIDSLLPVCEGHGRDLIVRSWSVGIGALGDLIWSPQRYAEAFGGYSSPHLIVSVKHGPADFFRHLPPNPTLGQPGPRQLVELQTRREYELFGLAPAGVARLHGAALARAADDPQCLGFWAWNSTGGWGGGTATLGTTGWNLWTELGSALTAALAQAPDLDSRAFVGTWLRERMQHATYNMRHSTALPDVFAEAVAELYLDSEDLIERGWYMGRLPQATAKIGGVYLSPLLWVWWMRPTASLPIWAYLTHAAGDWRAALEASEAAARRADAHALRLETLALAYPQIAQIAEPSRTKEGEVAFVVESARYLADALALAHATRALMLPLLAGAWLGRAPTPHALRAAACEARTAIAAHNARWAGRADFPALELDELEQFVALLERRPRAVWLQARAACALVRGLRTKHVGGGVRLAGAAGLTLALIFNPPAGLALAGAAAGLALAVPMRRRMVGAALPWLSRRLNLLPSMFFEAGPSVGEWV